MCMDQEVCWGFNHYVSLLMMNHVSTGGVQGHRSLKLHKSEIQSDYAVNLMCLLNCKYLARIETQGE